ncbi:MAG: AraC family transcriptional regulator [Balneolaceae bacterium]|nr:MAG: AraC family transcriptional regulator [Balneolaceae bacterium]
MKISNDRLKEPSYRQMDIAVGVLISHILEIRNVTEWAACMGYSRSHFCRRFKKRFQENPKMVLRRARFRKVCRVIQSDWSATAYKVALESGFENDKALHKFLQRNFNWGFLSLKDELKRNAFRSRKIISFAAESDYEYIIGSSQKRQKQEKEQKKENGMDSRQQKRQRKGPEQPGFPKWHGGSDRPSFPGGAAL